MHTNLTTLFIEVVYRGSCVQLEGRSCGISPHLSLAQGS